MREKEKEKKKGEVFFTLIVRGIQSIHKTSDRDENLPCFECEQLISTA